MNWIIVDLDCTLCDTKALVQSGGPEPTPGTIEHADWVKLVTHPETLLKAPAVKTILNLVRQLEHSMLDTMVVFLTNRRTCLEEVTKLWLAKYNLPNPLFMRPQDEHSRSGAFKGSVIKRLISAGDSVLIIDDDDDRSIEAVCREMGWTHLKITTY